MARSTNAFSMLTFSFADVSKNSIFPFYSQKVLASSAETALSSSSTSILFAMIIKGKECGSDGADFVINIYLHVIRFLNESALETS